VAANVEIKARVDDLARVRETAARLADGPPEVLRQTDTFFQVPAGRLKVRTFADGTGELIGYDRPDTRGPKISTYSRLGAARGETLAAILGRVLPVRGTVVKEREVFLIGRTRVHLDRVEGLGSFVELEVVLAEGEAPADGEREAGRLMDALGIAEHDLVAAAYMDLLDDRDRPRPGTTDDVPGLAALARACIAEMRAHGIDQWDEIYPTAETFLADAQGGGLFVLPGPDGVPDGAFTIDDQQHVEYAKVPWTIQAARIAVVHRLMVHPRRQGEGLARRLMLEAERRAVERGFEAVRLDAFTQNPAALRLYRRLGYHDAGPLTLRKGPFRGFEKKLW
jgi:adenylate cyclase class IV/ribosomal protein S18 acetylase RimI-like enzyme